MRWIILGAWTLAIAASLTWNLFWQDRATEDLAHAEAVTLFQKDLLLRRWVTNHGGVYVPITTETQPNPHLKHPEREIFTPADWPLTLINPSYLHRQLYELAREAGYPQGRLSSLKPLNPVNQPDPWERKALLVSKPRPLHRENPPCQIGHLSKILSL